MLFLSVLAKHISNFLCFMPVDFLHYMIKVVVNKSLLKIITALLPFLPSPSRYSSNFFISNSMLLQLNVFILNCTLLWGYVFILNSVLLWLYTFILTLHFYNTTFSFQTVCFYNSTLTVFFLNSTLL